jgi:predicted enzyme related to lactoylglutathione lyase
MEVTCVTVDAHDPARVAMFWSQALSWSVDPVAEDGIAVVRPDGGGQIYLELVAVPEQKVVKNRLHLGCSAGPLAALDAEVDRLVGLGATVAWEEEFPADVAARYRNVVLRDPEGNEFCVSGGTLDP